MNLGSFLKNNINIQRANAMPKTCYIDGRVIELLDLVIDLSKKL